MTKTFPAPDLGDGLRLGHYGKVMMEGVMEAIDYGFNCAVMWMADVCWPQGYDVAEVAPDNFPALAAEFAARNRITVWSGASDSTIYGDPAVNYAFRAWHDFCHVSAGLDFSFENEKKVAEIQQAQIRATFGENKVTERWCKIVEAEIIGQAEFFRDTGDFPVDQIAFVRAYLGE